MGQGEQLGTDDHRDVGEGGVQIQRPSEGNVQQQCDGDGQRGQEGVGKVNRSAACLATNQQW